MSKQTGSRRAAGAALLTITLGLAVWMAVGAAARAATPSRTTSYGRGVAIGDGEVRAYVTSRSGVPEEVGVILTEAALSGLPAADHGSGVHVHGHTTFETVLELPSPNPTPYRHVLVNWNPGGHEPPGIYDLEHFDFHFYTTTVEERHAIDESDPGFQEKAERTPAPEYVPEGYILPAPLGFPRMGVHWVDPSSPELNGATFTHTFIFGSWDGRLTFAEPMITKAFLETKQDVSRPVPLAARQEAPGYYPTGYTVRWMEDAKAYRIALTDLVWRD